MQTARREGTSSIRHRETSTSLHNCVQLADARSPCCVMKMYDFSERTICQKLPYMKPHENFVCKFKASHYNTTIMYASPLRIGHSVSPGVPEMICANVTDIYPDLKSMAIRMNTGSGVIAYCLATLLMHTLHVEGGPARNCLVDVSPGHL